MGCVTACLVIAWAAALSRVRAGEGASGFETSVRPLLSEFCFSCHGKEKKKGDLDLERLQQDPGFSLNREVWEKVRDAVESREMPPENKPQPGLTNRSEVIRFLESEFARADAGAPPSPGRVTIRRLNRNEYRNTIRDLLAVDFNVQGRFPNDESGYGFDNIGDVLSLPPMLFEKYLAAAEEIAGRAILTEDPARRRIDRVAPKALGEPPEEYPESHRRVLSGRPEPGKELAYATDALRRFAARAYRRPVGDAEVAKLVRFVEMAMKDGGSFEAGVQLAVQAVLVSPYFLYRWELDPAVGDAGSVVRDLGDYEVASRLSYFLWSSMPDETLFALAAGSELRKADVLEAQVLRMLRDPKSDALIQNFGGQWLQIRNLDQVEPDATIFKGWSGELRDAMRRETELFLRAIVNEDRDIRQLVDADFTFLNERLARHYGIAGVEGPDFRRVTLEPGSGRGGVITMGSVLTITSVPTRTSPVLRGKWIMEQILGTPPPPPPNVPPVETSAEAVKTATLRQRLEIHRSKPECRVCHEKMDPLGFALENFDAVGAWRDKDGPHPVDNTAELPGGRKFVGAEGLKGLLSHGDDFPRALSSRLLTYALGRGLEFRDRGATRGVVESLVKNNYKFSALVLGVVRSDPFLKRQTDPAAHGSKQHANVLP